MKRGFVLGALIATGGFSIAVSALQQPPAPAPAAMAATKIEKVKDNLYIITGSGVTDTNAFSGGNTAVFITDAGVVLVDTKLPGWGPTILERIKSVTDKPVTTIINTHAHGDHVGSNEFFGAAVQAVVHENAKTSMAATDEFKGANAKFLPKRTYKDKLTLGTGKDQIDLYYFGPGHTNGDTFVVFPALRTLHAGDMFAWKALPLIDTSNGGSALGHAATFAKVVATIKNVDTVITGHIPVANWNELTEYANFSRDFVTWAQAQKKAGKTVEQAASDYQVPPKYQGYSAVATPLFGGVKANVQAVYDESK
jgi:glyoxylase-like metal-dependent hydrolase (beta-lactamase superfamily II)